MCFCSLIKKVFHTHLMIKTKEKFRCNFDI